MRSIPFIQRDYSDKEFSPMMRHYLEMKSEYLDEILFYRLGDFYEMFFEDAEVCSRELELTLTAKQCGKPYKAPMCGVPFHSADTYIAKLIEKGYKVAICEQIEDPKLATGLVDRAITRVATPGTVIEDQSLKADRNNFLCSIFADNKSIGICWADISTGLMEMCEVKAGEEGIKLLDDILSRIKPTEIIANSHAITFQKKLHSSQMLVVPEFYFYRDSEYGLSKSIKAIKTQFQIDSLAIFDAEGKDGAIKATGALLSYLAETQMRTIGNIKKLHVVKDERYVHIDINARRNLELVESMNLHRKKGSLLGLLDHTKTPMGARKMRLYIDQPLRDEEEINDRLDGVEELVSSLILRDDLDKLLRDFQDIERKCSKVAASTILPKECLALASSLAIVPKIKNVLDSCKSRILYQTNKKLSDLSEICSVVYSAINPECSSNMKDGGFINRGFDATLDQTRVAGEFGKQWLAELEQSERERTGIRNLKTGFNRVFGYYIEISKSWLNQVPDNYIRKQSLTTGERFITPELKEMEYKILNSEEESLKIELEIYGKIKQMIANHLNEILDISDAIATLDCLLSFAFVACKYHYCKPVINSKIDHIKIVDGRHPVVEDLLEDHDFSPNDTILDPNDNRIMLITGPNMAGKSTYMRQVAIITLMAHMGCFVPAKSAEISIVDRVFTRVGASDDLAFGRSTFMVEMSEVSSIISNATDKSLIILDEVGRGTSTYDGLSIAWAIMEYLGKHLKAKTLFSTHYHELTELEGKIPGVKNYRVMVKEIQDAIIFMHKIARGSANKSFGIEVAKLAGLPKELIDRAKEVLKAQEIARPSQMPENMEELEPMNVNTAEVINVLRDLDMDTVSPIMAFGTLQNLVDKVKK